MWIRTIAHNLTPVLRGAPRLIMVLNTRFQLLFLNSLLIQLFLLLPLFFLIIFMNEYTHNIDAIIVHLA